MQWCGVKLRTAQRSIGDEEWCRGGDEEHGGGRDGGKRLNAEKGARYGEW